MQGTVVRIFITPRGGEPTNLPEKTRRNIVVTNFPLNDLVGKEFFVGNVKMRGVELCDPKAFFNCGGLRAKILTTGQINEGDAIINNEEIINRINTHQKNEMLHPLTCRKNSLHALLEPIEEDGRVILICPTCGHKQVNWPIVILGI